MRADTQRDLGVEREDTLQLLHNGRAEERKAANAEDIEENTEAPDINARRVLLVSQDLGSHVRRRPAGVAQPRLVWRELLSEPKVNEADVQVPVEENVLELDVPRGKFGICAGS